MAFKQIVPQRVHLLECWLSNVRRKLVVSASYATQGKLVSPFVLLFPIGHVKIDRYFYLPEQNCALKMLWNDLIEMHVILFRNL